MHVCERERDLRERRADKNVFIQILYINMILRTYLGGV